jgi:zinc and cadmium transporter
MISIYIISGILISFIIEKAIHWKHCHHMTHNHHIDHKHHGKHKHIHTFALMNLFGDAIHNIIDGLIIGASYLVSIPVGIATTIAVVLHEIPQEFGDFAVLLKGGFSAKRALLFNFLVALTSLVGVLVSLVLASKIENLTNFLVPFAAGAFIYIAGSDLIPELHKEVGAKQAFIQIFTFILGIAIMASLILIE